MKLTPPQLRELQKIANMGESGLDTSQHKAMEPVRRVLAAMGLVEFRYFHGVGRWFLTSLGGQETSAASNECRHPHCACRAGKCERLY